MTYNFDEVIERRGTDSVKWDGVKSVWGRDDLLPMWVADMDFRTPPFVMEALRKRLEHEVLGYTSACEEWYTSICSWLSRRHGWDVTREMLTFVPGIVRGQAYQIDFERFRKDIQGCKVLILCNPHNPGGRVWTVDELRRIADICTESHTFVISDEIHADLTLPPYKHHPFATVSGAAAQNSLTFMAPSKTFNMPGLGSSYAIILNEDIRHRFQEFMQWLEQLLDYIKGNIDFTENYLREHIPGIGMIRPQASYLIYLDCRGLGLTQEELVRLFVDKAHLALNDGTMFGEPGKGFMRLNIGCPRSVLEQALKQLETAVADK